eukprot:scaffold23837_cov131-Amphora_coffeaeformis.AAC.1
MVREARSIKGMEAGIQRIKGGGGGGGGGDRIGDRFQIDRRWSVTTWHLELCKTFSCQHWYQDATVGMRDQHKA